MCKITRENNDTIIRASVKEIFENYKWYANEFYGGKLVFLSTFIRQIQDLGVVKLETPHRVNGSKPCIVVDISFRSVKAQYESLYCTTLKPWYVHTHPDEFTM